MMNAKITVLPGDGIGVEVTQEAVACLDAIAERFGHVFQYETCLIGGIAVDQAGAPLPEATLQSCLASNAVLLGAVGGPQYDALPPRLKPETGLLGLRAGLGVYANLRPAFLHETLIGASPLKPEIVRGTDLLIVRELAGGAYFGQPREITEERGLNTMAYTAPEVERVARVAFELARGRRRKLTSIDKANVLESSQLWRKVVTRLGAEYPDVTLEHGYVDSCAMALVTRPTSYDVIVTENLFGDILSDEASVLTGKPRGNGRALRAGPRFGPGHRRKRDRQPPRCDRFVRHAAAAHLSAGRGGLPPGRGDPVDPRRWIWHPGPQEPAATMFDARSRRGSPPPPARVMKHSGLLPFAVRDRQYLGTIEPAT